jgi:putative endonuclease
MTRWSTYILRCGDGSLYTGISTDVEARVRSHAAGKGAAYTRSHLPVKLVWVKKATSESAARKREAAIKKMKKREKEAMISRR